MKKTHTLETPIEIRGEAVSAVEFETSPSAGVVEFIEEFTLIAENKGKNLRLMIGVVAIETNTPEEAVRRMKVADVEKIFSQIELAKISLGEAAPPPGN